MSLERRYVDILTMGRSGIDIFPLQVGAHLEDVETFGKFLGGSPTNVAVAAAHLGHRSGVITGAGDAFGGTLIHGLVEGRGLERTIRYASAAGAYVCLHIECSTAMPTCEQLHAFVETGVVP